MASRTLQVRCSSWEQVDIFTTRKLRKGKLLSMKVPFSAKTGMQVTIGLELPNEVVVAIEGVVQKSAPVEVDGKVDKSRTWIEIELTGFTDEVKARLKRLQRDAEDPETDPNIAAAHLVTPAPPVRRSQSQIGGDDLPADERELFQHLTAELRRLRQAAVHDVLGVPPNAGPELVRASWKDLIRRNHPDLVARRNAPAITHLAEELTILANRAYDRMRTSLVAEGRAATAGPTVASPAGWLVAFEDIKSDPANATPPKGSLRRFERPPTPQPVPPPPPPSAASGQGSEAYEGRARAMLALGDANAAREVLAAALVVYPRSKPLRSLYYVATALAAVLDGELMLATAQLETALAHHEQCSEASKMLEHIRRHGTAEADAMRRLFR
ncbi:MAG TPA: J domain-containing protein [Kofleriaceae bacterium]|nr:J domain-containing protein [Kofleriaceae bacterium]